MIVASTLTAPPRLHRRIIPRLPAAD